MLALYVYLQTQLSRLTSEDEGATAVEYGLIFQTVAGALTPAG
jgi:Flp pilus assembly pilin Flp